MKNIILGMIGCYMTVLVLCAGISIYAQSSRQNEISNAFSLVMKQALEKYYIPPEPSGLHGVAAEELSEEKKAQLQEEVLEFLEEGMKQRITSDSDVFVEIRLCDMEKGILSAAIRSGFAYPTGTRQEILAEKTVLYDREVKDVTVTEIVFCVDGQPYKNYRIMQGEPVILPRAPQKEGKTFAGWQKEGTGVWFQEQTALEDSVWHAVFE